jgi:hypothetical protein
VKLRRSCLLACISSVALGVSAAAAQESATAKKANGLDGAASCIAANEHLVANKAGTSASEHEIAEWRKVMQVIEATDEDRQAALAKAKASFDDLDSSKAKLGMMAAKGFLAACSGDDKREKYVAKWASPASAAPRAGGQ